MDAKRKIPYVAMNWVKLAGEFVVVTLSAAMALAAGATPFRLDLSGEWDVRGTNFAGRVHLPGTLADAGLGTLQTPEHFAACTERTEKTGLALKYKYRGKAVYSRTFSLAKEHAAKPLEVFLERVMWSSRLKIDGRDYGLCDSLGAPHVHRVHAGALAPGVHRIEIEIDNSKHYGVAMKAHGYSEWMQSVWHGAIGRLEIREANPLDSVRVFASFPAGRKVRFELPEGFSANAETVVSDSLKFSGFVTERSPYAEGRVMVTASLSEETQPWDEFNPRLYDVTFRGAEGSPGKTVRFGFRTIGREGNRLMLNGRPLFVRADIDNCHFPLTGYPDMSRREWDRFFAIQRSNGMNAIQMHTWTPPEAAFELFKARLLVRNMLSEDIPAGTRWRWSLGDRSGWAVAEKPIPSGALADVGGVEIPLAQFGSPRRLELRFGENAWRIYVLPTVAEIPAAPGNVLVTADPAAAKKALAEGGRVVYTGGSGKGGLTAFKPIYWSTGLFPAVHKHIGFGAVVDSSHPALAPTGCDRWQDEFWRRLFEDGDRKATAHRLEGMPRDFRPIVTVVPDLHHSYFISPLFEVKVGEGRLLVCGLTIDSDCPAARLLKKTLWRYAGSEDFAPRWSVEPGWFDAMFLAGGGKTANDSVKLDADTQDMLNVVKPRP
ncbi:MAG: hypothetical protein IJG84_07000 [Kiritimatiellae bacterium]|nr:hypothetical protein [Kiritimatiellia bacterium]